MIAGVGHHRLLRSADRTERIVEGMLVAQVLEREQQLEERRMERMANAIAKRFG